MSGSFYVRIQYGQYFVLRTAVEWFCAPGFEVPRYFLFCTHESGVTGDLCPPLYHVYLYCLCVFSTYFTYRYTALLHSSVSVVGRREHDID